MISAGRHTFLAPFATGFSLVFILQEFSINIVRHYGLEKSRMLYHEGIAHQFYYSHFVLAWWFLRTKRQLRGSPP